MRKTVIFLIVILLALFICAFIYFTFDKHGSCNSDGYVWDNVNKECRSDCIYWNEEEGCVIEK